ncbi:hypothetical protein IWZ03DRAFT_368998 [Phyllosticta citriasiana]|uniref:Uncharacterized protein n=1 Tax=Phyllosticta citriasiana TaxID=595635 RepID=A0ABR1KUX2_9PEZI
MVMMMMSATHACTVCTTRMLCLAAEYILSSSSSSSSLCRCHHHLHHLFSLHVSSTPRHLVSNGQGGQTHKHPPARSPTSQARRRLAIAGAGLVASLPLHRRPTAARSLPGAGSTPDAAASVVVKVVVVVGGQTGPAQRKHKTDEKCRRGGAECVGGFFAYLLIEEIGQGCLIAWLVECPALPCRA